VVFRHLIALRIPSGWAVEFNNFVELDPPASLPAAERDAFLSQDLLSLRSTAPEGASASGLVLDVGWRPDADPTGRYLLQVLRSDGQETGIELASRHSEVIRDAIEVCLHRLNAGDAPERVQRILIEATTVDGRSVD
jgi:hypothetical protein